ncbi:hydrogenase formation protein HypD [Nannocystis bainbridge]|uniref:Hydrogenase formation protein HypD n=1 Tax=Nannocystis bainbridge TaxID=2995303 RepID=A0ABT5E7Q0_9BACT|nr:hydrogenase formation protein HypD [Nannocystis bainbridge]MDC0720857.1 hydrogenase formation protein HypD [Nannocystis bainbridge]
MKYVDEYRSGAEARRFIAAIRRVVTRPWSIMEVCGGQTHAIVRFGIEELLPPEVSLLHGPGCPVCVTPCEILDQALALAGRPEVTFCSYGDMLRVPGSDGDLFTVKAKGGDVRVVYSALDALALARQNPAREVVFLAVGFETTAPAHAMAAHRARIDRVRNFSLLVSHVLVPPALAAILSASDRRVDGFLAAGHVCTIMGTDEYERLARDYGVPIVVTGFEPLDLLQGIHMCLRQLEEGRAVVTNQYERAVGPRGNEAARRLLHEVFEVVPRRWRGLGELPASGLALRPSFAAFDATLRFGMSAGAAAEPAECISGLVLQGRKRPTDCPAFGTRCTPDSPVGATMVSAEGACAAYFRYRPRSARDVV